MREYNFIQEEILISYRVHNSPNVTTKVELGAFTPRVSWFGGTGFVSGAPKAGSNHA